MHLSAPEGVGTDLTEVLNEDTRGFLLAIVNHRTAPIEQNHEALRVVLPETLASAELRDQFFRQFAQP